MSTFLYIVKLFGRKMNSLKANLRNVSLSLGGEIICPWLIRLCSPFSFLQDTFPSVVTRTWFICLGLHHKEDKCVQITQLIAPWFCLQIKKAAAVMLIPFLPCVLIYLKIYVALNVKTFSCFAHSFVFATLLGMLPVSILFSLFYIQNSKPLVAFQQEIRFWTILAWKHLAFASHLSGAYL